MSTYNKLILIFLILNTFSAVLGLPFKNVLASVGSNAVQTGSDLTLTGLENGNSIVGSFLVKQLPADPLRQFAASETEGFKSKAISVYDNSQNSFGSFKSAEPIVDHIREEDKYGNSGDKFQTIGRAIVNGMEGLSNLINKIFETPKQVTRQVTKSITDKLNTVGGKLVGL